MISPVLGMEPRALYMLGKYIIIELQPLSLVLLRWALCNQVSLELRTLSLCLLSTERIGVHYYAPLWTTIPFSLL